jgi:hypothetical protein
MQTLSKIPPYPPVKGNCKLTCVMLAGPILSPDPTTECLVLLYVYKQLTTAVGRRVQHTRLHESVCCRGKGEAPRTVRLCLVMD